MEVSEALWAVMQCWWGGWKYWELCSSPAAAGSEEPCAPGWYFWCWHLAGGWAGPWGWSWELEAGSETYWDQHSQALLPGRAGLLHPKQCLGRSP